MKFNVAVSGVVLATVAFGCKTQERSETNGLFGSRNQFATVRVKQAMSSSGQVALGTNEHIPRSERGALGVLTPGVWFCGDFNIQRGRSKFEEVGEPILCNTIEKDLAEYMPKTSRIPHSLSKIECKKGSKQHELDCTVQEKRIPIGSMYPLKPDLTTKLTLTGGFNPNRIIIGNPTNVRWDKWSAIPSVTPRDSLFCERYVKNDKGEMIAIDNMDDTGLDGSQTARCFGSREALFKNLDLNLVEKLAKRVKVNGVDELVVGNLIHVGRESDEVTVLTLQAREEELR